MVCWALDRAGDAHHQAGDWRRGRRWPQGRRRAAGRCRRFRGGGPRASARTGPRRPRPGRRGGLDHLGVGSLVGRQALRGGVVSWASQALLSRTSAAAMVGSTKAGLETGAGEPGAGRGCEKLGPRRSPLAPAPELPAARTPHGRPRRRRRRRKTSARLGSVSAGRERLIEGDAVDLALEVRAQSAGVVGIGHGRSRPPSSRRWGRSVQSRCVTSRRTGPAVPARIVRRVWGPA